MNNEFDLSESIEKGIRDNAGQFAVAGALMAHAQRQNQIREMEAARKQQTAIAGTEAERLEIEKQRLKLEQLRHEAEKTEKEAVRQLRVMMAEVGAVFDGLVSRGELNGSPEGLSRELAMAVHLSKLSLARARIECLSDLGDLKELTRLESQAQEIIEKYFARKNPIQVARKIWDQLDSWTRAVQQIAQEVEQAVSLVPEENITALPSEAELAETRNLLQTLLSGLNQRLAALNRQLPTDYIINRQLLPELSEQGQLQNLIEGGKENRVMTFNKCLHFTTEDGKNTLTKEIENAIQQIGKWQTLAGEHGSVIHKVTSLFNAGQLSDATKAMQAIGIARFKNFNYLIIDNLVSVQTSLSNFKTEPSKINQVLLELRVIAKEKKKMAIIGCLFFSCPFIIFVAVCTMTNNKAKRQSAEAEAKTELIADEVRAKAGQQAIEANVKISDKIASNFEQDASINPSLDPAVLEIGKDQFLVCGACHGQNGEGTVAGPPLAGSQWVNGPISNLVRIQLRGLKYQFPEGMMAMSYQTDEQIAGVLTYVRNSFGNKASAVKPEEVSALRGEVGKPQVTVQDLIKP